uniref:Uncharacterized protein n=1 Tax=Tanacetum cinerariifolium TaxID=118510 RepID=A0A6L2N1C9_TANCI|nr:hypothetical protein [Tanacetum cinerariifolium]
MYFLGPPIPPEAVKVLDSGSGGGGGGEVFGGGVFGGSIVFSGDGVGNRVRCVVCGEVQWGMCRDYHPRIGMRGLSWSHGAEMKDNFVKCNMTGNDDFVGVQFKAPISLMIVKVPEKDKWCGAKGKFMRWKGVRVTKASKHVKVGVRVPSDEQYPSMNNDADEQ